MRQRRGPRWTTAGTLLAAVVGALLVMVPGGRTDGADPPDAGPAAFARLHAVATHPRCVNCHGLVDAPRAPRIGDAMEPHPMNITCAHNPVGRPGVRVLGARADCAPRNADSPGLVCTSCHGVTNRPEAGAPPGAHDKNGTEPWQMPTHPRFALSPGMPQRTLCTQWFTGFLDRAGIKEREYRETSQARDKLAEELALHFGSDPLIQWSFEPNCREPDCPQTRSTPPHSFAQMLADAATWERWLRAGGSCDVLPR